VPLSERHDMGDVNIRAKTMHIRPDRGSLKGLGTTGIQLLCDMMKGLFVLASGMVTSQLHLGEHCDESPISSLSLHYNND
jgi:hypothetical protein